MATARIQYQPDSSVVGVVTGFPAPGVVMMANVVLKLGVATVLRVEEGIGVGVGVLAVLEEAVPGTHCE